MDSPRSDGLLSTNIEEKDAEIQRLTKLLEESRQDAYELRSRLQVAERCSCDYETELEALQLDALEKDNKHAAAIRELQEERSNVLKEAEEKIENWEVEYQAMSEKVTSLQKELDAKSADIEHVNKERNETAALQQELEEVWVALTASTDACKQHKELVSVLQEEKEVLTQRVDSLEHDLELYKEHLSVSKSQLSARNEDFKELQDHLAVTQSELSALKAAPDVQTRGNSLFAEVEDNRQQMVKQYKLMLAKFNHMKNDFSAKTMEIAKLKKEKSILVDKLEIAERDAKKHYCGFVENYEIRIEELQTTIRDMKNDVKPVYLNGNEAILKFAEHTVANSRKEIVRLREEMELRSALRLNEAAELLKTRGELAEARTDLRKYANRVKELTVALQEQGVTNVPSSAKEPTFPGEVPPYAKSSSTKNTGELKLKPPPKREVIFPEELLPDRFNPNKRSEKTTVVEDSLYSPIRATEVCDSTGSHLEKSTKVETAVDKNSQDDFKQVETGESNAANWAVELGCNEELKTYSVVVEVTDERDFSAGENVDALTASEEMCKDLKSSILKESVNRKEEMLEDIPCIRDESFASLMLSPTSSEYVRPEVADSMDSSPPALSNAVAEKLSSPLCVKYCDGVTVDDLVLKKDLTPLKTDKSPRCDTSKCDEVSRSILKVRPDYSTFENSLEVVTDRKEVRFDSQDFVELNKENAGGVDAAKVDEYKENDDGKKPVRRRPRPNQGHRIIFMTS